MPPTQETAALTRSLRSSGKWPRVNDPVQVEVKAKRGKRDTKIVEKRFYITEIYESHFYAVNVDDPSFIVELELRHDRDWWWDSPPDETTAPDCVRESDVALFARLVHPAPERCQTTAEADAQRLRALLGETCGSRAEQDLLYLLVQRLPQEKKGEFWQGGQDLIEKNVQMPWGSRAKRKRSTSYDPTAKNWGGALRPRHAAPTAAPASAEEASTHAAGAEPVKGAAASAGANGAGTHGAPTAASMRQGDDSEREDASGFVSTSSSGVASGARSNCAGSSSGDANNRNSRGFQVKADPVLLPASMLSPSPPGPPVTIDLTDDDGDADGDKDSHVKREQHTPASKTRVSQDAARRKVVIDLTRDDSDGGNSKEDGGSGGGGSGGGDCDGDGDVDGDGDLDVDGGSVCGDGEGDVEGEGESEGEDEGVKAGTSIGASDAGTHACVQTGARADASTNAGASAANSSTAGATTADSSTAGAGTADSSTASAAAGAAAATAASSGAGVRASNEADNSANSGACANDRAASAAFDGESGGDDGGYGHAHASGNGTSQRQQELGESLFSGPVDETQTNGVKTNGVKAESRRAAGEGAGDIARTPVARTKEVRQHARMGESEAASQVPSAAPSSSAKTHRDDIEGAERAREAEEPLLLTWLKRISVGGRSLERFYRVLESYAGNLDDINRLLSLDISYAEELHMLLAESGASALEIEEFTSALRSRFFHMPHLPRMSEKTRALLRRLAVQAYKR